MRAIYTTRTTALRSRCESGNDNLGRDDSTITTSIRLATQLCPIRPTSALPSITAPGDNNVHQTGARDPQSTDDAVIRIELNGVNAGANVHGLASKCLSTNSGTGNKSFHRHGIGLLSGSSSGLSFSTSQVISSARSQRHSGSRLMD